MSNQELATRLNELASNLAKISDQRIIPYLGWYWRDITDFHIENLVLSLPENSDFYWLDVARKWDYQTYSCSSEESAIVMTKLIKIAEAYLDYVDTVRNLKK